jgi:undecaprenyl-diphosphatase
MFDLGNPYPFGFGRRNWPLFAVGFIVLIVALSFVDGRLSHLATGQGADVVAFFNGVTRWGQSDWILYPSFFLLVVSAVLARLLPDRLTKLALIEMIEVYAIIFVGVGLPGLLTNIVKRLIGRSRPELLDTIGSLGFHPFLNDYAYQSFPSGHTTTAFAAAMVLGFLAPRWFLLGLAYAVAIALSRLVVGAHYPTDVIGGAAVGTLGAYAVRDWFAARRWGFERTAEGRIVARPMVAIPRLVRRFTRRRGSAPARRPGQP